ncbi:MAG: hypothetical protein WBG50_03645 [Desulfomonilaceae bacterium]
MLERIPGLAGLLDVGQRLTGSDKYVKIQGGRESIKCSAYSVFPVEVKDLFHKHPAMRETAVIGARHSRRGATPVLLIVKQECE